MDGRWFRRMVGPRVRNAVDGAAQVGTGMPRGAADELHEGLQTMGSADTGGSEPVRAGTTGTESPRPPATGDGRPPVAAPQRRARQRPRSGDGEWPDTAHRTFADWLWDARNRRELSQADIAERIGQKSKAHVGQIERGGGVTRDTARRLLEALRAPDEVHTAVLGRYFGPTDRSTGKRDFPDPADHDFPNTWFRAARVSQEIGQADLAERANVAGSTLGMKERAEVAPRMKERQIGYELALRLLDGLAAPEHVTRAVVEKFYRDAAP